MVACVPAICDSHTFEAKDRMKAHVGLRLSEGTQYDPSRCRKVQESQMAGMHATMWIVCRMPDWLYFGNFDLVSKQIEMAGAQSKCFGNVDARIEMDRNRSN
jgi:hypothetical protein